MMDCQLALRELTLLAGGELQEADLSPVIRRHWQECAGCQEHVAGMQQALGVLRAVATAPIESAGSPSGSIWERVQARLTADLASPSPARRFNGWIPATAMSLAIMMLFGISFAQWQSQSSAPLAGALYNLFNPQESNVDRNLFVSDPDWRKASPDVTTPLGQPRSIPATFVLPPPANRAPLDDAPQSSPW